jgi:hypothetical protein
VITRFGARVESHLSQRNLPFREYRAVHKSRGPCLQRICDRLLQPQYIALEISAIEYQRNTDNSQRMNQFSVPLWSAVE